MASDLSVGVSLARAAMEGALANVDINLGDIKDAAFLADVKQRVEVVRR
jgi:formiminotetrahydrofolate cyclodeaminase